LPLDLIEERNEQRQIDRVGQRNSERADLAALECRCQRACADGRLIALLEQRVHALAELGQLCGRPLAPEQVKLLDRACQRRLRHVTLVGGAREIQRPCHRQEVPHLMHFHDRTPLGPDGQSSCNHAAAAIAYAYRLGSEQVFPLLAFVLQICCNGQAVGHGQGPAEGRLKCRDRGNKVHPVCEYRAEMRPELEQEL
jgi:hypothetical protein